MARGRARLIPAVFLLTHQIFAGQFSFYPCATKLWSAVPHAKLARAYAWLVNLFPEAYRAKLPPCPTAAPEPLELSPDAWTLKQYASLYLTLEERLELIESLVAVVTPSTPAPLAAGEASGAADADAGGDQTQARWDECSDSPWREWRCTSTGAWLTLWHEHQVDALQEQPAAHERTGKRFALSVTRLRAPIDAPSRTLTVHARYVIMSTGRFGPLQASTGLAGAPDRDRCTFRRLEFGCRIVDGFYDRLATVDPKLLLLGQAGTREADVRWAWRTFCACRRGETCLTQTQGIWSFSGRADVAPTNESNIGFNVRVLREADAAEIWAHLQDALRERECVFDVALAELLQAAAGWDDSCVDSASARGVSPEAGTALAAVEAALGPRGARMLLLGCMRLAQEFPSLLGSATARARGPTLEGVGWYARLGHALESALLPGLFYAGDATGMFRGIVASMLSGHAVAQLVTECFTTDAGNR